jgi:SPP1 family predicted phage head-tail adaptor
MTLAAGKLRHRVRIERYEAGAVDSNGDTLPAAWVTVADNVAAAVEPLSAREYAQSQAIQSKITTRITIRRRDGLDASMRIVHGSTIYNPEGFIPDKDSMREYLTVPCSQGVNNG